MDCMCVNADFPAFVISKLTGKCAFAGDFSPVLPFPNVFSGKANWFH